VAWPDQHSAEALRLLELKHTLPGLQSGLAGLLARRYPEETKLALAWAEALIGERRSREALDVLMKLPESPERFLLLGLGWSNLGQPDKAQAAWLQSGLPEASARLADLVGETTLPPYLSLKSGGEPLPIRVPDGVKTVFMQAWKVNLETLVLSYGGMSSEQLALEGLPVDVERVLPAQADRSLLARLDPGAWVISLDIGGAPVRSVVLVGGPEIAVSESSGGSLIRVSQSGVPAQASIWVFTGMDPIYLESGVDGTAWVAASPEAVLVKVGERYGWVEE
jgi:hypothetical protein